MAKKKHSNRYWLPKDRPNIIRWRVFNRSDEALTWSCPRSITKETLRNYEDLFQDIQDRFKDGGQLCEKSLKTIESIRLANESQYKKLVAKGFIAESTTVSNIDKITIREAFEEYAKRYPPKSTTENAFLTLGEAIARNLCTTPEKLLLGQIEYEVSQLPADQRYAFDRTKRLRELLEAHGGDIALASVSAEQIDKLFNGNILRTDRFITFRAAKGKPPGYSAGSLKRMASRTKQVFSYFHKHKRISKDVLKEADFTFTLRGHESDVADKDIEYVDRNWEKALATLPDQTLEDIEIRCLLCWYRWLGPRFSCPKKDRWDHVFLDDKRPRCHRHDTKRKVNGKPRLILDAPIEPQLWVELDKYRKALQSQGISLEGRPLFPWLQTRQNSTVAGYYKARFSNAGIHWDQFFNTIRALRSNEWVRDYGIVSEAYYIGHSEVTAMKAYLKARPEDFDSLYRNYESKVSGLRIHHEDSDEDAA